MFELLCITGFIMCYLFIYFLQWFAICSYLFGNHISSFRTLFFSKAWIMFMCFNVIDKQKPFFQSESYPEWSSHFSHEIQTVLHDFAFVKKSTCQFAWVWLRESKDLGCWNFQDVHAMEEDGARPSSQDQGADLFVKGRNVKAYLVVPEISRKSSLSLYIYIYTDCMLSIYVYVATKACQLVFRISQVGGMLWLQHFGVISGSLKMFLHAQSLKI